MKFTARVENLGGSLDHQNLERHNLSLSTPYKTSEEGYNVNTITMPDEHVAFYYTGLTKVVGLALGDDVEITITKLSKT